MATIRSFSLAQFYIEKHLVRKGEYVLLIAHSEDNSSAQWSRRPEEDLATVLKDFKLVYKSPKHFNNTHTTEGLRTLILEKVN